MIAFIGGTGPVGKGLAMRFALAGEKVIVGSRREEKARRIAREIEGKIEGAEIKGMENKDAARVGEIIFLTTPFKAQAKTLGSLRSELEGKIVVDVTNPFIFDREKGIKGPKTFDTSAAEEAQKLVPDSKVVSAFKNISSKRLLSLSKDMDDDIVVCSDYEDARKAVIKISEKIKGIGAIDGGKLENSRVVEALTSLILYLNKKYKKETGIRFSGIY